MVSLAGTCCGQAGGPFVPDDAHPAQASARTAAAAYSRALRDITKSWSSDTAYLAARECRSRAGELFLARSTNGLNHGRPEVRTSQ